MCIRRGCLYACTRGRCKGPHLSGNLHMISLSLPLSAELQLHIGRRVVKAAPAYVVRQVVNAAPAEVFSRIARDNEDFSILESSFFLRPSFLLVRSQLGCQPSSILDLVAPSPHRIDSQFLPIFLQSCPPFTFPIFNLSHYPLPREVLFSPSRTMNKCVT